MCMRLESSESDECSTSPAGASTSHALFTVLSTHTPVLLEEAMHRRNTPRMFTQKRSQRLRRLLISDRTRSVRGTVS